MVLILHNCVISSNKIIRNPIQAHAIIIEPSIPTNQKNWPNVFPYMALYWANVLAIVLTLGQFSWFAGMYILQNQTSSRMPGKSSYVIHSVTWKSNIIDHPACSCVTNFIEISFSEPLYNAPNAR